MDNTKLKNFRLDLSDIERLEKITESVSTAAGKTITQTRVIRALIQIGPRLDPGEIVEVLRTELL